MNCEHCGGEFTPAKFSATEQKFCSRSCGMAFRAKAEEPPKWKACPALGCRNAFLPTRSNHKFCSRKCSIRHRSMQLQLHREIRVCIRCGAEYLMKRRAQKFCGARCQKAHNTAKASAKYYNQRYRSDPEFRASERRRQKAYKEKAKRALAAKQRVYAQENRDKIRATRRKHYQRNREAINAKRRERYRQQREEERRSGAT